MFATHEVWVFGLELMHRIDIDVFAFHLIERTDLEWVIIGITWISIRDRDVSNS